MCVAPADPSCLLSPRALLCPSALPAAPALQEWVQPEPWDLCPAKLIPVDDLTDIMNSMVKLIPADFVPLQLLSRVINSSRVKVASASSSTVLPAGAKVLTTSQGTFVRLANTEPEGWHDQRFGVLGQAYNVFEGGFEVWGWQLARPATWPGSSE